MVPFASQALSFSSYGEGFGLFHKRFHFSLPSSLENEMGRVLGVFSPCGKIPLIENLKMICELLTFVRGFAFVRFRVFARPRYFPFAASSAFSSSLFALRNSRAFFRAFFAFSFAAIFSFSFLSFARIRSLSISHSIA